MPVLRLTTTVLDMSTWFEGEQMIHDYFSGQNRFTRFGLQRGARRGRHQVWKAMPTGRR